MPKDRNATFKDAPKAAAPKNSHEEAPSRCRPQLLRTNSSSSSSSLLARQVANTEKLSNEPETSMHANVAAPRNETSSKAVNSEKPQQQPSAESAPKNAKTHTAEQNLQKPPAAHAHTQITQVQTPAVPAAHPQDVHSYYHPSVMPSYVSTHPQDSVASHSHYHHPAHWAPTHASPYTWVPAPTVPPPPPPHPSQPGQPATAHHPHQIHAAYGVGHVSVSPTPYPVAGPVWAGHPAYAAPVPMTGAHFGHYYPQAHPTHVQGHHHYAHSAHVGGPASSAAAVGSAPKSAQEGASAMPVQAKSVNGVNSSAPETQDKIVRPAPNESKDLREKPGGSSKPSGLMDVSQKANTTNEQRSAASKGATSAAGAAAAPSAVKDPATTKRTQSNNVSVQQPIRKTRKPYTKTKNRESWSEKEHQLFLQALNLYNRDWKRIESFIGTKTVLQIRSHAQKHFCKVTKYKTGEYIPPPRPKRRASRPYPRSRGVDAPEKTDKNAEMQMQKAAEGGKTASDSCAGSSENGNVSGNGKSSSNGSSESAANSTLPPGQRSSNAALNSNDKSHGTRAQLSQPRPPSSGFLVPQKSSVSPSMQCYNPYYYNTGRANPNSLPFPPGYYQNHYSQPPVPVTQHHPFYACYDQNCSHYQSYQGHGHVHLTHPSLPPVHAHTAHPHAPNPYTRHAAAPQLPSTAPTRPRESHSAKLADDAAARRAHRAKIIRGRKSSTSKTTGQESEEAKDTEIASVEQNKTSNEKHVESTSDDKKVRSPSNEKLATVASLLNSSSQEPRSNVLIGPNTGSTITGLIDVGSDEAVAGFSGSDGQGSSDGSPQEGQERSGTPEEDPNSSSGDDGRGRNTRGSSPTDPNSGGSREDTPCQNEINGSRNVSPQDGATPTQSRETTPSENGGPVQSGKKNTETTATTDRGGNANVHLEAAEALLKYRNSNQTKTGAMSKPNTCRKAGINNLLNSSPQMVDVVQRSLPADQKRGRSPPNEVRSRETGGNGGTGRYKDEPSSQRRRHNSAEVEPTPEGH